MIGYMWSFISSSPTSSSHDLLKHFHHEDESFSELASILLCFAFGFYMWRLRWFLDDEGFATQWGNLGRSATILIIQTTICGHFGLYKKWWSRYQFLLISRFFYLKFYTFRVFIFTMIDVATMLRYRAALPATTPITVESKNHQTPLLDPYFSPWYFNPKIVAWLLHNAIP